MDYIRFSCKLKIEILRTVPKQKLLNTDDADDTDSHGFFELYPCQSAQSASSVFKKNDEENINNFSFKINCCAKIIPVAPDRVQVVAGVRIFDEKGWPLNAIIMFGPALVAASCPGEINVLQSSVIHFIEMRSNNSRIENIHVFFNQL